MKKYRNPTLVKIIIFITLITSIVTLMSADNMFGFFGSNEMEPFIYGRDQSFFNGNSDIWNIGTKKEAGILAMLSFLIILLISFVVYRVIRSLFNHYKTANKAIKKDN